MKGDFSRGQTDTKKWTKIVAIELIVGGIAILSIFGFFGYQMMKSSTPEDVSSIVESVPAELESKVERDIAKEEDKSQETADILEETEQQESTIQTETNTPADSNSTPLLKPSGASYTISNTGIVEPPLDPFGGAVKMTATSTVWVNWLIDVNASYHALQFEYDWLSNADGILSVSFDGELVFAAQEETALPGFQDSDPVWLGEQTPGEHIFSVRLDSLDGNETSIIIRNVEFGSYVEVSQ